MNRLLTLSLAALCAAFLAAPAFAEGSSPGGSTKQQLFQDTDGTYYGCMPGSQVKGKDLTKCTKLPDNVVAQIKASGITVPPFPTGAGGGTSGGTDSDKATVLVSTPSGALACPVTAFSATKTLDPSLCTAATLTGDQKPRIVCQPPSSSDAGGVPTPSTGTTLVCSMPGDTYSKNPLPKFDNACPGGGTRTVTGGYDTKTGIIDITITLTACVDSKGNSSTGSAVMQGTLTASATGGTGAYDLNETKTVSSTVTFASGGQMSRACTITRKGSYNDTTGAFNGTVTRNNCSLTGSYKFKPGLVDNLLENAGEAEAI